MAVAVGFVCRFPHGTGWVPAIVSPAGTRGGGRTRFLPTLTTLPGSVQAQPGADGTAQPSPGSRAPRLTVVRVRGGSAEPCWGQTCLGPCWLCSFVFGWEGEQHPGQGEAGMPASLGRDGDGCCCPQQLGAALLLAPGRLCNTQKQQFGGILLPLCPLQPSGRPLEKARTPWCCHQGGGV